jgi:DMSO/TMAO reductase YedYZ molybdopterin-dependent catalytic subunit
LNSVSFASFVLLPLSAAPHTLLAVARPGAPLSVDHGAGRHSLVAPWVVGKSSSVDAVEPLDLVAIPGRC